MAGNQTTTFKARLYDLSWGLYPRRVTIYLKERQLSDEIEIVPLGVTPTGIASVPGKPPGSVPILEVKPGVYVRQSSAILEYLEDAFSQAPKLRGDTAVAAAHNRELMDIANEITSVFSLYVHQASELFAPMEEQSQVTAAAMRKRMHVLLKQLEDMSDEVGPFLVQGSGSRPSIVDCVMLSTWQFADHIYKVDIFEGHPRLRVFLEAMIKRDSAKMEYAPDFILEKSRNLSVR